MLTENASKSRFYKSFDTRSTSDASATSTLLLKQYNYQSMINGVLWAGDDSFSHQKIEKVLADLSDFFVWPSMHHWHSVGSSTSRTEWK